MVGALCICNSGLRITAGLTRGPDSNTGDKAAMAQKSIATWTEVSMAAVAVASSCALRCRPVLVVKHLLKLSGVSRARLERCP